MVTGSGLEKMKGKIPPPPTVEPKFLKPPTRGLVTTLTELRFLLKPSNSTVLKEARSIDEWSLWTGGGRTDGQSSGEMIIDLRRMIRVALSVREFLYRAA